jgi:hypothetical protein
MRILVAAATIALAPYLVLTSAPAHATCSYVFDPASGTSKYICEQGPQVAANKGPLCAEPNKVELCTKCQGIFGQTGQAAYRAQWACGAPGRQGYYNVQFPCYVGTIATDQPDCDGTLDSSGKITRKSGKVDDVTGTASSLT